MIDLGDSMDFTLKPGADEDTLTCNMEGVPTDSSNLVIKVGLSDPSSCIIFCRNFT